MSEINSQTVRTANYRLHQIALKVNASQDHQDDVELIDDCLKAFQARLEAEEEEEEDEDFVFAGSPKVVPLPAALSLRDGEGTSDPMAFSEMQTVEVQAAHPERRTIWISLSRQEALNVRRVIDEFYELDELDDRHLNQAA